MEPPIVTERKDSADSPPEKGISDSGVRPTVLATRDGLRDGGEPMSGSVSVSHSWVQVALATGLLLPLHGAAQAPQMGRGASSSFSVSITIRPQFRILESRPVSGGHEYRVWTNMKSVQLNGREYRFERVGESTVVVPGELIELRQPEPSATSPAQQGG